MEQTETSVVERQKQKLDKPRRYKVVIYNDDETTMDFVVDLLQHVFDKTAQEACTLMLAVHNNGSAVVAVYPSRDIAQSKVRDATRLARAAGFPLKLEALPC